MGERQLMEGFKEWHIFYAFNVFLYGFMLYVYIVTPNGLLRKGMIALFTGICISLVTRLFLIGFDFHIETINLITIVPSSFGALIACIMTGVFYFKK